MASELATGVAVGAHDTTAHEWMAKRHEAGVAADGKLEDTVQHAADASIEGPDDEQPIYRSLDFAAAPDEASPAAPAPAAEIPEGHTGDSTEVLPTQPVEPDTETQAAEAEAVHKPKLCTS